MTDDEKMDVVIELSKTLEEKAPTIGDALEIIEALRGSLLGFAKKKIEEKKDA